MCINTEQLPSDMLRVTANKRGPIPKQSTPSPELSTTLEQLGARLGRLSMHNTAYLVVRRRLLRLFGSLFLRLVDATPFREVPPLLFVRRLFSTVTMPSSLLAGSLPLETLLRQRYPSATDHENFLSRNEHVGRCPCIAATFEDFLTTYLPGPYVFGHSEFNIMFT